MQKNHFANFNELRKIFNSVDSVGNDRYVFNIKGNHYRLNALIHFDIRIVYILFVGTHAKYDRINAATIKFKKDWVMKIQTETEYNNIMEEILDLMNKGEKT